MHRSCRLENFGQVHFPRPHLLSHHAHPGDESVVKNGLRGHPGIQQFLCERRYAMNVSVLDGFCKLLELFHFPTEFLLWMMIENWQLLSQTCFEERKLFSPRKTPTGKLSGQARKTRNDLFQHAGVP